MKEHAKNCACGCQEAFFPAEVSRKDFLKKIGAATIGMGLAPLSALALSDEPGKAEEFAKSTTIRKGKAKHITLLHTSDIHGQVNVHDEFFWENDAAVYKKRGGFAHLKTLLDEIRKKNSNTLLLDGGDCFQGSAIASLSQGQALVPLMNFLNYNLMLPGNWEVAYGKKMLMQDMGSYHAPKVCANMFHDDTEELMFPPYQTFFVGGIKIGFVGYNDPLTPIRQSPAYSKGIRFSDPEKNISKYIRLLREQEQCQVVIALTHMGMAQQLHLSNQSYAEGLDYIFGADTHERIRTPLQGKYARVTEPGAFSSFVGKMDLVIENGKIKEEAYELLEVDPAKYKADQEMQRLVEKAHEPYLKEIKKVVGRSSTPLMRYFIMETPMDNLITDAIHWKAKTDIAVSNGFRFCPPQLPDPKTGFVEITREYLWSMVPVDADMITGKVSGKQLRNWLEKELENVFAKDPTKRFGGWLVRFQGMKLKFTIANDVGKRIQELSVNDKAVDDTATYTIAACEREGDPDSILCRIKDVKNVKRTGYTFHSLLEEYMAQHSPVSPKQEGRVIATDAAPTLLTQVQGVNYQFR